MKRLVTLNKTQITHRNSAHKYGETLKILFSIDLFNRDLKIDKFEASTTSFGNKFHGTITRNAKELKSTEEYVPGAFSLHL
jgi:hypothetical protein